jgi:hypothetical protein
MAVSVSVVYSSPSVITVIKSRMKWAVYVARVGEKRNVFRLLVGKPEGKRPLGRPRRRCVDNTRMDLGEIQPFSTSALMMKTRQVSVTLVFGSTSMQFMIREGFKVKIYTDIFVPVFQTNLTLDWDYSIGDYMCNSYNRKYLPSAGTRPILECENIPKSYMVSDFST